ncbi:hypothetical protein RHMOL_Rhmol02G0063000 [Rhododendron molle]|uniref:Uncharacterized protein n=1 Tax=Rhododendron molle TaxID=49168 RepID=A0ACC0PNJ0_RHOML|nr:hypothetical protein RHMOL_Rhmol02G0063000 [Rhododendron molle]
MPLGYSSLLMKQFSLSLCHPSASFWLPSALGAGILKMRVRTLSPTTKDLTLQIPTGVCPISVRSQ